jgi:ribosomal-protein-alanine N-acetyltransferase
MTQSPLIVASSEESLRTGRPDLMLRPFTPADAAAVTRLAGDRRIAETTARIPHPYPEGAAAAWIAGHATARASGEAFNWAMESKALGELVGAISLDVCPSDERATLGYWVGHAHWGQGLATAAAMAVTDWALAQGIKKLHAECLTSNLGSVRVLERCSFVREGRLLSHVAKMGQRHDLFVYGRVAGPTAGIRKM